MRIWDFPVRALCRSHLLGEHRELHTIWTILTDSTYRGGYRHHPETKRWIGHLPALFRRHAEQVRELRRRGYKHQSPLKNSPPQRGLRTWPESWQSVDSQYWALTKKRQEQPTCTCNLEEASRALHRLPATTARHRLSPDAAARSARCDGSGHGPSKRTRTRGSDARTGRAGAQRRAGTVVPLEPDSGSAAQ